MKPIRSLSEVGTLLNLDSKQVWYIEKQAFKKLRKRLAHLQNDVKLTRGENE